MGRSDRARKLVPYGTRFTARDLVPIPEIDLQPGAPPWMRSSAEWAWRRPIEDKDGTNPAGVTATYIIGDLNDLPKIILK